MIKIKNVQIDPNGTCNASCWFCPVAYLGNPQYGKSVMPVELLESILKQLRDGMGDFVDPNIEIFSLAQFNEPLMYPHFEELLKLFRKYKFRLSVLTNGTNLTKQKTDLLKQYPDVATHVCLNIPSAFKNEWSKFTGFNEKIFDKMIINIRYAIDTLDHLFSKEQPRFVIQVNGVKQQSLPHNNGMTMILENAPVVDLDNNDGTIEKNKKEFKRLFPELLIWDEIGLSDRNGLLYDLGIISNQESIKNIKQNKTKVVGCKESRAENSIHINSKGDVFFCYNDFNFDTIFGNVNEKTIKEIWHSQERQDMIKKSFSDFCTKCIFAEWE